MKGECDLIQEIENCPGHVVIGAKISVPQQSESFTQNNDCGIRGSLIPLSVTCDKDGTVRVLCSSRDCPLKPDHPEF